MQRPVYRDSAAPAGNHKYLWRAFRLRQLHTAKKQVITAGFHAVKLFYGMVLQHLLRRPKGFNGLPLNAQKIIGNLHGKVDFVQGQNHRKLLLLGHFPQDVQQLNLIADIQIGCRFVQYDDLRLLAQSPGQENPLPLPIG